MIPTIISACTGTSGLSELLTLLSSLFFSRQNSRVEQSIRGLFDAANVVGILKTFETLESRLKALRQLVGLDTELPKSLCEDRRRCLTSKD